MSSWNVNKSFTSKKGLHHNFFLEIFQNISDPHVFQNTWIDLSHNSVTRLHMKIYRQFNADFFGKSSWILLLMLIQNSEPFKRQLHKHFVGLKLEGLSQDTYQILVSISGRFLEHRGTSMDLLHLYHPHGKDSHLKTNFDFRSIL